jgi:hypothetical protein
MELEIDFGVSQHHTNGRFLTETKVFIYQLTAAATIQASGEHLGQMGLTGVFDVVDRQPTTGTAANSIITIRIPEWNEVLPVGVVPNLTSLWAYTAPVYTSHVGYRSDEFAEYSYRRQFHPRTGAFMDGRLWQGADMHNRVYFSQILQYNPQGDVDYPLVRSGMCYIEADPTNPDDNSIVPTDGGYINLADSGEHRAMHQYNRSMLVFSSNGVWEITGSRQFSSFSPDSFSVKKLTDAGCMSGESVLQAMGDVYYYSEEGIMKISTHEISGNLFVTNITDKTIRKRLLDLDLEQQLGCQGAYDPEDKTIRWIFPERDNSVPGNQIAGNTVMLTWSMIHNAWFEYNTFVRGIANLIVLPRDLDTPTYNQYRYLVVEENPSPPPYTSTNPQFYVRWHLECDFNETGTNDWIEGGLLQFDDTNRFRDFQEFTPATPILVTPPAFLETAHHLLGDGTRWMHVKYVTTYNRRVTTHWVPDGGGVKPNVPGSTLLRFKWDWSDIDGWGKHTSPIETYRNRRSYLPGAETTYNSGEPLLVAKSKVRGRGREFRVRWDANEHNDSHIVGWTIEGIVGVAV